MCDERAPINGVTHTHSLVHSLVNVFKSLHYLWKNFEIGENLGKLKNEMFGIAVKLLNNYTIYMILKIIFIIEQGGGVWSGILFSSLCFLFQKSSPQFQAKNFDLLLMIVCIFTRFVLKDGASKS